MVTVDYITAQSAVLGSLLISPELTGKVMTKLHPEDFGNEDCRLIYQAITGLFLEGRPVDPVLVRDHLSGFPDIGQTLWDIMTQTPTAANIWEYVRILQEQSRVAKLQAIGAKLFDVQDVAEAQSLIAQANGIFSSRPGVPRLNASALLSDFYDRHSADRHPDYITWGFPKLDDKLYTEAGDFVVLGGYPSSGKTALALRFAWHQAQKYRVGFYSLETRTEKLADRSVATLAAVDMGEIKHSNLSDASWRRVADRSGEISGRNLEIIQAGGMSVEDIQADALAHRYEVIYVDYLQLIKVQRAYNRTEAVTTISIGLHQLAQTHGITVVALSQLRRPDTDKRSKEETAPTMASLRESGQIEQDADVVMLLHREDPKNPASRRILQLPKNKEGVIGRVTLEFDGATQTFRQADTSAEVAAYYSAKGRAIKRANRAHDPEDQPYQVELQELDDDEDVPF